MRHKRKYEFIIKTSEGETFKINNKIMFDILSEEIKIFQGVTPDLEIKYLAVGTDNTAVTGNETKLGAEIFRTAVIDGPDLVAVGKLETEFQILESQAQVQIEEIGIFCGSSATSTQDTGTLLSRALFSYDKLNNNVKLNITRIDQVV